MAGRRSKYFEPQTEKTERQCDFKGCSEPGLYRAPKDRSLSHYYWFCLDHVREYNKNWNYYAGMDETEVESQIRNDTVWNRGSNRFGSRPSKLYTNADIYDRFGLFDGDPEDAAGKEPPMRYNMSPTEEMAFKTLNLTPPLNFKKLHKRYHELAKLYHPDVTGGDKQAEERFKSVAAAYTYLKEKLQNPDV